MNLYDSRILLIDDNIELAHMVRDMLRRNGYSNVSCAHTCEQGMSMFREEAPQLVILDIMLPDGDGFSLFRRIRDISEVPILFLSAKDEDNDRLFGLGLSVKELMERGVKVGADVPYCLLRGTALAEGIGDKLRSLPACPGCYVLIGKPGISVSTKFVYENLHADQLKVHPNIDKMLEAIQWHNLYKLADLMGNVLETVTIPKYPVIQEIKDHMKEHGALNAMMSGSGPTVFGLFDDKRTAEQACEALRSSHVAKTVFLTTVFNNGGRRK